MFCRRALPWAALFGVFILSGCSGDSGDRGCLGGGSCSTTTSATGSASIFSGGTQLQPVNGGTSLIQCSVSAPNVVLAGENVTLTLSASGGVAASGSSLVQYSFPSMPQYGSFSSAPGSVAEISETGSYVNNNTNGATLVASRTFPVTDAAGNTGTCSFSITVEPAGSSAIYPAPAGSSVCSLSTSTPTPIVNEPFYLTLSSVEYPILVQSFSFESDWQQSINASLVSGTSFSVTYLSPGVRTITAVVEAGGYRYTCSTSVNVMPVPATPSLSATAQPGNSVKVGATISLQASANGFPAAIQYHFSTSEPGVQVTSQGNSAVPLAFR